jgi:predicted RNA binding protein YcfA (HicA-like mRNA interferase family)
MNIAIAAKRSPWIRPKLFMPSARADEFRRVAMKLGFRKTRQRGSHERWVHNDGRSATIPIHGGREIGPPLFNRIIRQFGVTPEDFARLR